MEALEVMAQEFMVYSVLACMEKHHPVDELPEPYSTAAQMLQDMFEDIYHIDLNGRDSGDIAL